MCAFLCNPNHIGKLAAFVVANEPTARKHTAQDLAVVWARANLRSVGYRYEQTDDEVAAAEWAGFDNAADYIMACKQAATWPGEMISPVQAHKAAVCLNYQSCEVEGWLGSEAERLIDYAKHIAVQAMPGYEEAAWEIR